ncbi:phosphoribosyltransferase family protein [Gammaproteobacteria bacterium]|nr:phosphoribosyltransferase family protein [Gammaproteobacteria bacterium]
MSESIEKHYVSAGDLLVDSFRLARNILEDGFRPTFIIGIWRGGAPVGIAVQELFDYAGVKSNHIAVRTAAYRGLDRQKSQVEVYGLGHVLRFLNHDDHLLIVDDIFDSGRSIETLMRVLNERLRRNMPEHVRIATPWYKPNRNTTDRIPDYYLHETDDWIVFPHEIGGLSEADIAAGKPPEIVELLQGLNPDHRGGPCG